MHHKPQMGLTLPIGCISPMMAILSSPGGKMNLYRSTSLFYIQLMLIMQRNLYLPEFAANLGAEERGN